MKKNLPTASDLDALDLGDELALDVEDSIDLDAEADALDLGDSSIDDEKEEERGSFEEQHVKAATEIRTAFLQRAKDDKARYIEATDSEFWFCVCFRTREQKEAFLAAVQWPDVEPDDKYVHGERIALALGIGLPPARFVPPNEKVNKDMVRLGLIGDE